MKRIKYVNHSDKKKTTVTKANIQICTSKTQKKGRILLRDIISINFSNFLMKQKQVIAFFRVADKSVYVSSDWKSQPSRFRIVNCLTWSFRPEITIII